MHNLSFRNAYNIGSSTNGNGKASFTYQERYSGKNRPKCDSDFTQYIHSFFHTLFAVLRWPIYAAEKNHFTAEKRKNKISTQRN